MARLTAVGTALLLGVAGCGSSVGYSTSGIRGPLAHRANVVVADIVDGRGYSTPLLDGHELDADLAALRQAVRKHASALGLTTVPLERQDESAVDGLLASAAERQLDAVILLRVRRTSYGGRQAGIHRVAGAMSSLFFLGLLPALIAIILESVPASDQFGHAGIEAIAVHPGDHRLLAYEAVSGTHRAKVSGWSFAPTDELGPALRDACGKALERILARVDQGAATGAIAFESDRFVHGQKLRTSPAR